MRPAPIDRRRDNRRSIRRTLRLLTGACVLLALMCVALAAAWRAKDEEAACFRAALAEGATPAVADLECSGDVA